MKTINNDIFNKEYEKYVELLSCFTMYDILSNKHYPSMYYESKFIENYKFIVFASNRHYFHIIADKYFNLPYFLRREIDLIKIGLTESNDPF